GTPAAGARRGTPKSARRLFLLKMLPAVQLDPADEEQALKLCQAGNPAGLAVLYGRYRVQVWRTCLRILGDKHEAEDLTQEVFLKVFHRVAGFQGRSGFSTWLYRLTVNLCLNRTRLKFRKTTSLAPLETLAGDGQEGMSRHLRNREARDLATRLLARLSREQRAILVLREMEELSYTEIAAVLEIPAGTVMSRLSRARQALRRAFRAEEGSDVRPAVVVSMQKKEGEIKT
ncbi:MAG: RNA polymerase sigma factor, partial [Acidobacteriota bacterium]